MRNQLERGAWWGRGRSLGFNICILHFSHLVTLLFLYIFRQNRLKISLFHVILFLLMSKITDAFSGHKALITYITAGDPSLAATEKLVYQLEKAGADIIELGIPFSDPLADGPVIQASHQRALKKDVALADVFKLVSKIRKKTDIPLCFMLSYNLVVKYGVKKYYDSCVKAKIDGVIIPDLSPEETGEESLERKVDHIFMVAPTSKEERVEITAKRSRGFVYLISVSGITGKRPQLAEDLIELIARVRKQTNLPIAVGFGISTPAQALAVSRLADGVIVGSAIVDLIAKGKIKSAMNLVSNLRKAIDAS